MWAYCNPYENDLWRWNLIVISSSAYPIFFSYFKIDLLMFALITERNIMLIYLSAIFCFTQFCITLYTLTFAFNATLFTVTV
jgi:hypothetical protein